MKKSTVFNAESAYYYFTDSFFRNSIMGSSLLYCDSVSLSLALRLRGIDHKRLHGPDFMDHYLRTHASERIMIIGGSALAHEQIAVRYDLKNTCFVDRSISVDNTSELLKEIGDFQPKIVFVCLGLRKQEAIADVVWRHFSAQPYLSDSMVIGVGAAVDFLGQTKVRAGRVWQKIGMEWLPRLLREPRMAPRILRSFVGCLITTALPSKLEIDNLKFAETFDA